MLVPGSDALRILVYPGSDALRRNRRLTPYSLLLTAYCFTLVPMLCVGTDTYGRSAPCAVLSRDAFKKSATYSPTTLWPVTDRWASSKGRKKVSRVPAG